MAREKRKKSRVRRLVRWLVTGGGIAYLVYTISERQKPGPCVPAGGADERILVKDEENLSGLGMIMRSLIAGLLEEPAKVELLNGLNLSVAIEPREQPETAITMTFSDGYIVLEPGVSPSPDIRIVCDIEVLMQMAGMGSGLEAMKFVATPEGKELAGKFFSGELKIEGLVAHPVGMIKFTRFLSQGPG